MKPMFTFLALIIIFTVFPTCIKFKEISSEPDISDLVGTWVSRSDFDGVARGEAPSIYVNNKIKPAILAGFSFISAGSG